jgi:hypothetical protein
MNDARPRTCRPQPDSSMEPPHRHCTSREYLFFRERALVSRRLSAVSPVAVAGCPLPVARRAPWPPRMPGGLSGTGCRRIFPVTRGANKPLGRGTYGHGSRTVEPWLPLTSQVNSSHRPSRATTLSWWTSGLNGVARAASSPPRTPRFRKSTRTSSFAKVDTEAEQQLAAEAGISSIPTLMAFREKGAGLLTAGRAGCPAARAGH